MSTHDNNSIPDLVELCLRVEAIGEDSRRDLKTDLRIHPASLDGPDGMTISVSLKKLTLDLELNGASVVPGSRCGEPTKPNIALRELTVSTERTVEKAASGDAGARASLTTPIELSGKGSLSHVVKTKEATSRLDKQDHYRVRAMGNLKWEVSEPPWEKPFLDLTYLNNEAICQISMNDRANNRSIHFKAVARQKDITLEVSKPRFPRLLNNNQKKLLAILISKAISSEQNYSGTVTFSESVGEIED